MIIVVQVVISDKNLINVTYEFVVKLYQEMLLFENLILNLQQQHKQSMKINYHLNQQLNLLMVEQENYSYVYIIVLIVYKTKILKKKNKINI